MKYEKIADCPARLAAWLELINSVPFAPENHLPLWDTCISIAYSELTGESNRHLKPPAPKDDYGDWKPPTHEQQESLERAEKNALNRLEENTKRFPKLHSYLFELKDYPALQNKWDKFRFQASTLYYRNSAYQRYETFLRMRDDIHSIAQSCTYYRKTGRFVDGSEVLRMLGGRGTDRNYNVALKIDAAGRICFESDLIDTLSGVDANRLRICPICKSVFWAKRIEAATCSKECSNNYQRRKRQIEAWEKQLDVEYKKLEKLRSALPATNNLIAEQTTRVNKIIGKINPAKLRNGCI